MPGAERLYHRGQQPPAAGPTRAPPSSCTRTASRPRAPEHHHASHRARRQPPTIIPHASATTSPPRASPCAHHEPTVGVQENYPHAVSRHPHKPRASASLIQRYSFESISLRPLSELSRPSTKRWRIQRVFERRLCRRNRNRGGGLGGGHRGPLRTKPYGHTRVMNFSGGGPPHCETSASSADRRLPPFFALRRSVSAQCSWTRPHGSAQ